jgi:manganese/zinc/iron transport system permease protein
LTGAGLEEARRVTRRHRLWELYLANKLDIAADHVHDDAEEIEHILTPELEARLLEILGQPAVDPHRSTIPATPGSTAT